MINSDSPTVLAGSDFSLDFYAYVRTDNLCEIVIATGRDCWSAL